MLYLNRRAYTHTFCHRSTLYVKRITYDFLYSIWTTTFTMDFGTAMQMVQPMSVSISHIYTILVYSRDWPRPRVAIFACVRYSWSMFQFHQFWMCWKRVEICIHISWCATRRPNDHTILFRRFRMIAVLFYFQLTSEFYSVFVRVIRVQHTFYTKS